MATYATPRWIAVVRGLTAAAPVSGLTPGVPYVAPRPLSTLPSSRETQAIQSRNPRPGGDLRDGTPAVRPVTGAAAVRPRGLTVHYLLNVTLTTAVPVIAVPVRSSAGL